MVAWKTEIDFNHVQTALIISQDTEMVSVWETLFQQKNCYVVNETSPRNAIQTARLLSPSLIVLDLKLSHAELLILCMELRAMTQGTLLLLVPKGNEQEMIRYRNAGVDECLITPISPMALLIKSMAWLVRQELVIPQSQSTQIHV